MVRYVQGGDTVGTTASFVKRNWTFTDLIPCVFINNSDDSISMTRGASSLEDYFWNLLIRHQLAVFQTPQQR